jgi:aminopeptidase
MSPDANPELLEQLARLAVHAGANVQRGQVVAVATELGKEALTHAVAREAYSAGARFVDPLYFDVQVKRARLELADGDMLDYVPPWYGARMLALGDERAARIFLAGTVTPDVLAGVDPDRAGRDKLPWLPEILTLTTAATTNWTIVPCPTAGWAGLVHPELGEGAFARLCEEIAHVCRFDSADPVEAWGQRMAALEAAAGRMTERRFDALHFEGPGTDLTIGLFPSGRWATAKFQTVDGIPHIANLPSEEVFTCPDPARADGTVRSTKPLVLADGTIIRGLTVRFEGGRAVEVDADEGAGVMRGRIDTDEGAARLGEVALVDREGRIGQTGTTFYDTLLDENAASHIALGNGFDFILDDDDRARRNESAIHIDFMIGAPEVEVTALTRDGARVPVLRDGAWQI